jgi:hypothetical protein
MARSRGNFLPNQGRYESNASYLDRLVKHYGVTENPGLGGYILPDGTFLDFSEGSGSRCQDHRNISGFSVRPEGPYESRWDLLERICKRVGMYRWMPESWAINAWTSPTREQILTIATLASMRPITLDLERGRKGPASRTFDRFFREYDWGDDEMQPVRDMVQFYR